MQTAVSPDGLHWHLASESLPLPEWFEVNGLHRFHGWYYATGQQFAPWVWLPGGRECGRVMVAFRSRDFVRWSRAKALSFQRPAQKSAPPGSAEEVHMGAGLWNRGNVLLGLYGQFHGAPVQFGPDVSVDLGLIVSNDGLHFREPEVDFKALGRGRWDVGFLMQVHGFDQVGDETWVWYSGLLEPGNMAVPRETGLAMWRRDGFGYLAVKDRWEDGHLLTCPVSLDREPARIYLNVDHLGEGASARVEVLDGADRPLPGYGPAEAVPIVASGVRQSARWQGRETIAVEDGRPLTIKVTLHPTQSQVPRLYAVYVARA
jgi:hypothetical protein